MFGAALVQASAGVGFAMICVPLLALIDVGLVPGPMLIAMLSLSLLMSWSGRRAVNGSEFITLIPALLVGTVAGVLITLVLETSVLGLVFGVAVLIGVAVTASGLSARLSRVNLALGGMLAGLMGTVAGIHGPPLVVLYARQSPAKVRATIAGIFVIGSMMSLAGLAVAGKLPAHEWIRGLQLVPGTVLGFATARLVHRHVSPQAVRRVMLSLTAASALILIAGTEWR